MSTIDVLTVKDAEPAPAGITTLEGTLAAPLLLKSATMAPPVGAALVRFTVPEEGSNPPVTLEGLSVNEARASGASGTGVTVSVDDLVTPAETPDMLTG